MSTYDIKPRAQYLLDAGDVIRVSVYGEDGLSRSYKVDDSGMVALPLVGSVHVGGQTTSQASGSIAQALASGYMRSPSVAVEIDTYRPFYIQGAVKNAGQFVYVSGMTVRAAVSTAGGYSDTADRTRAVIYRRQGREMVKRSVDLDFPIYPGDVVVVSERWL